MWKEWSPSGPLPSCKLFMQSGQSLTPGFACCGCRVNGMHGKTCTGKAARRWIKIATLLPLIALDASGAPPRVIQDSPYTLPKLQARSSSACTIRLSPVPPGPQCDLSAAGFCRAHVPKQCLSTAVLGGYASKPLITRVRFAFAGAAGIFHARLALLIALQVSRRIKRLLQNCYYYYYDY